MCGSRSSIGLQSIGERELRMQAPLASQLRVGVIDDVPVIHLQRQGSAATETKTYASTAHPLVRGFADQCLVAGNTSAIEKRKGVTSRRGARDGGAEVGRMELRVCGEAFVAGNLALL